MISKYIFNTAVFAITVTVLASCIGGAGSILDIDPSRDAQIHSFSMSSRADTDDVLDRTRFTIDQVNRRIFNRELLPYQFSVDSVVLNIRGGQSNVFAGDLTEIRVHLVEPDTSFTILRTDSIPLYRLRRIETQAADRNNRKIYDFQLNIFQQDPFIISWVNTANNYIASPIQAQKTIALNERFFTYYISGGTIGAMEAAANDGTNWTAVPLTGLTAAAQLSSILSVDTAAFMLDNTNTVFKTIDGANWSTVATTYDVVAIFGVLPSSAGGDILLAVNNSGTLTFAKTDNFSTITLFNAVPTNFADGIPLANFSAVQVDNPNVYAVKYIILSGGNTFSGAPNNDIWLLEQAGGQIRVLRQAVGLQAQRGSRLFFYNNRLYMMIMTPLGENILMFSENYGISWAPAGEGQSFPADFTHRTHASVIADDDFIWVFGGQTPLGEFSDVWRGRLNLLDEVL